jgi:hypothetical protein
VRSYAVIYCKLFGLRVKVKEGVNKSNPKPRYNWSRPYKRENIPTGHNECEKLLKISYIM